MTEFTTIIMPLAKALLGEPNAKLSNKNELRYGARGSLSIDLQHATWFDHETNTGGGALDLVTRETKLDGPERIRWLEDNGFKLDAARGNGKSQAHIVSTYPYVDEIGVLLFEVVRFDPKDFRQRRPDKSQPGGWRWSTKGVRQVPYRLPETLEAIANGNVVVIVEGEKDVNLLWSQGIPATCNAGGTGKWHASLSPIFEGADVVIIPDHDPQKRHPKTGDLMFHEDGRPILPGQDHALDIARSLDGIAEQVRILDLAQFWPAMPRKGDVSDWLHSGGGSVEKLYALLERVPPWSLEQTLEAPSSVPLIDVVFPFPIKGSEIPRRPWIVPGLLLRRQVTVMVAPPGSGKSLLTMQLGMICGAGFTEWNGWHPRGRFKTLIINSEEDDDEMRRRLYAARHYMRMSDEMLQSHLAVAGSQENIIIARADSRTKTVTRTPLLESIIQTVIAGGFDIIIVDPFAETFAGDENSNSELKWAGVLWREVARRTNAAVLLVHHTGKYAKDMQGDPDAGRGGGSLTGIARVVCTVFTMTPKEAEACGVNAMDRVRYIRFDDAKANQSLVTLRTKWFYKDTVTLPNSGVTEPADEVGVLQPWQPTDALSKLTDEHINQILRELSVGIRDDNGRPTGEFYLPRKRGRSGGARWAGNVLKRFEPTLTDPEAQGILDRWTSNEMIKEVPTVSPMSKGKAVDVIKVVAGAKVGVIEQSTMEFFTP